MPPLAPNISSTRYHARSVPSHVRSTPERNEFIDMYSTLFKRDYQMFNDIFNKYSAYLTIGGPIVIVAVAYIIYRCTKSLRHSKEKKKKAVSRVRKEPTKEIVSNDDLNTVIADLAIRPALMAPGNNGNFVSSYGHVPPNIMITPATASPSKLKFSRDFDDPLSLEDAMDELGYSYGRPAIPQEVGIRHVGVSLETMPESDTEESQDITHTWAPQPYPQTRYLTSRSDYNNSGGGGGTYSMTTNVKHHPDLVYDRDEELEDVDFCRPTSNDTASSIQTVAGHTFGAQSDDFTMQFPPASLRDRTIQFHRLRDRSNSLRDTFGDMVQEIEVLKYPYAEFHLSRPPKPRRREHRVEQPISSAVAVNSLYLPSQTSSSLRPCLVQPVPRYPLHLDDLESDDDANVHFEASQGIPSSVVLSSLASRIQANSNLNMSAWDCTRARSCFAAQRTLEADAQSQTTRSNRARSAAGGEKRARSATPSRPNVI